MERMERCETTKIFGGTEPHDLEPPRNTQFQQNSPLQGLEYPSMPFKRY